MGKTSLETIVEPGRVGALQIFHEILEAFHGIVIIRRARGETEFQIEAVRGGHGSRRGNLFEFNWLLSGLSCGHT
jgi:hypothetical protein